VQPLVLSHLCILTSLGAGQEATFVALREGRSGLRPCRFESVSLPTHVGAVPGLDDFHLDGGLAGFDCRNNRLAASALEQDGFAEAVGQAAKRYGSRRIGVFVGTSTSGILQTEIAYRRRDPATGRFHIVDKSVNGTWLDGKRLKKGVEEVVPDRAVIGVAEVLTLSFEVRK